MRQIPVHTKSISTAVLLVLATTSVTRAEVPSDPLPASTTIVMNGVFGIASAAASLELFRNSGEVTPEMRVIFMSAEELAGKAWIRVSTLDDGLKQLKQGEAGAMRLTVIGLRPEDSMSTIRDQYKTSEASLREFLSYRRIDDELDAQLAGQKYPLTIEKRARLVSRLTGHSNLSLVPTLAAYVDSRHANMAFEEFDKSGKPLPAALLREIKNLEQNSKFIFTGSPLETSDNVKTIVGGRATYWVEVMKPDDFKKISGFEKQVRIVYRNTLGDQRRLKAAGGIAAFGALLFGGYAIAELHQVVKSRAQEREWTPDQIDVKNNVVKSGAAAKVQ